MFRTIADTAKDDDISHEQACSGAGVALGERHHSADKQADDQQGKKSIAFRRGIIAAATSKMSIVSSFSHDLMTR